MATEDHPAEYVCAYTIALLPSVGEEDFERHIVDEIWPRFEVTHRPTGAVSLHHSLQRRRDDGRADRYVWEIRVRFFQRINGVPDEAALTRLDGFVRDALASFGIPVTLTILSEVATARTQ